MQWDLFCRVVDNHGDIGVCWRLAADLSARGERVRLFVDDASALAWMAPERRAGVGVHPWPTPADGAPGDPGDVVIEAFGCALPTPFVARMAAAPRAPVWINLEYLSAEPFVERVHGLASQPADAAGLRKWFFYPGFTAATGGLLREPGLAARQARFDAATWLAARGAAPLSGERVVSLFCYAQPALPALLDHLAQAPTLLLATHGFAAQQVEASLGSDGMRRGALRAASLPLLTQTDYDHLLWASDLNFVRGEDSFVRAQWAGRPFVWQIYPQHDGAHSVKLDAFLTRFCGASAPPLREAVRACWQSWNGDAPHAPVLLPPAVAWRRLCEGWRAGLLEQGDLCGQLLGFVGERR
jgi:uncharacterized repeat protein (TIGR03837 family)